MSVAGHFFNLTKPTIMLLVVVTGASALALEGSLLSEPGKFLLAILALYLTGGSANALNQCLERDIDSKMKRTRDRRPLPMGKLSPAAAYTFSIIIGVAGTLIFALFFNLFSALLAVATIVFYSVFYTLWLKKTTDQNIVIGGAAGAMAPVITWAAATNGIALTPILLFMIVFLWTPPHFWALALFCKDDYKDARLPMMPVTRGDDATINHIIWYALAMVISSLTMIFAEAGVVYALVALTLGTIFMKKSIELRRENILSRQRGLFGYSIVYLFALFLAIVIDGVV